MKSIIEAHRFFFRVSKPYVNNNFAYYIGLPVAYCRFMWYMGRDWYRGRKYNG